MRLCLTPPRAQSTTLCLQIVIKIIHTCGKQLCDSPRKPAYADDDAMMSTRVQWPLYSAHRVDWYTKIDSVFWARSGPCTWHHHQVHTPRKRIDANVVRYSNHSFIDLSSYRRISISCKRQIVPFPLLITTDQVPTDQNANTGICIRSNRIRIGLIAESLGVKEAQQYPGHMKYVQLNKIRTLFCAINDVSFKRIVPE